MKGIHLLAILYVAILGVVGLNKSLVEDFPTECPKVNIGNKTVFVPHETDCTKFYSCHMGKKGEPIDCPFMDKNGNRLHFNPKLQVCDWPWSAGCQLSSSSPTIPSTVPTSITTPSSPPTPTTSSPITPTPTTPTPTPTPTTPTPTTPTPTTPIPTTPTTTTPTPTTPTPTTPTPTIPTPTTPTPTTPTPTTPTPTTPTSTNPSSSSSTSMTPPLDSCEFDGKVHMIPHKDMCDHYYSCLDGIVDPIAQKCDRNLLFNPTLRVCDFPENVNCSHISTDIPTTIITPPLITISSTNPLLTSPQYSPIPTKAIDDPSACVCVPNDKRCKIPHETECNYYYYCVDGIKGTQPVKCESYFLFNPVVGECDYPENVNCSGRNTPTQPPQPTPTSTTSTIPTKPTTPPTIPTKPTTPPTIPTKPTTPPTIPTKPTTPPTIPTKPTTPPTIPTKPTTPPTIPTKPTTPSTTTEPPTTRDPNKPREKCPPKGSTEKARIPHPCLCNQYYECIDGEKILERCPIGKHFDYKREVCDWAAVVKCIRPIPTFDLHTDDYNYDYDYDTTCAPEGRGFQHETDCSTYYLCSNGEKILRQCVEGLHFNVTIQTCDYPEKSCALKRSLPIVNLDTCPPPDSIENVFLPHECECTQYYECVRGKQVLRSCPNGLHFDGIRQICNDPTTVKCTPYRSSTTPRTVTTTMATTKATDKSRITCPSKESPESVRFPHPCLCNQYYECVEGNRILQTCPIGMYFDNTKKVCNWTTKVKCIQSLPSHDISIGEDDIKCSPNGRAFQHEVSCTEYYLCHRGEKILMSCVEGLHFNISLQMCDYPRKKCDQTAPLPTITLDICPPANSVGKVFLPHECQCTQYYECIEGKQVLRDCANGLHYDYVRQICNDPAEVKCSNLAPTFPTKPTDTPNSDARCYDEGSEMPYEYDCGSYYKCSNGKKILKTCPKNLHFNPKLRVCDFPENVACNDGSAIPTVSTPTKCGTTGTTKIPHEIDCNLYYVCVDGVSTPKKCSPKLVFNPILKVCDFPENYICNVTRAKNDFKKDDKMMTQNLDPSTCIGTCPEEDPEYAVLLPNDDCTKFCMCSGGVAWVQSCPDPLYFDSVQKICKRKKEAVCAKRQDDVSTIHDADNSAQILNKKNTKKYEIYNHLWSKLHFYNLDPSTCIGTCPEEDPEYAVLLPNEDCKKFCLCSNGLAYVQPCPEPLYFDSVDRVCKHKKQAVCAKRSSDHSMTIENNKIFNNLQISPSKDNYNKREIYDNQHSYNVDQSTCIGVCPEENSDEENPILLAHEDCRKYCVCNNNGRTNVQLCPEPLFFHSEDKVCKEKRHTICATITMGNYSITIDIEDDEDDSIEYESNEEKNDSKHREHKSSSRHKSPSHSSNPSTCIGSCSENDSMDAVLHPNKNCKKFCLCSNGMTWVQSCPKSLYFDSIHKTCKRKNHAVCASSHMLNKEMNNEMIEVLNEENDDRDSYDSLSQLHSHESTCIGSCSNENHNYAILLPNLDCKKFCMCSGGLTWIHSCPDSFYFDSIDKICKLKRNAICVENLFSKNQLFVSNKVVDENNLMTPLSEKKNHERRIRDIWSKLHFLAPQSSNNLDPSTCIGTCPEEDPEYAVLLPNDDCKKFCMCSNGIAWVLSCPEPLYFDSVEKICKTKKNAVCGVRSSSEDNILTIANNNDNSLNSLIDGDNDRVMYDNLDPSTCIGTCPEEDPEYAVLLPNDDCKKFCMCSNGIAWVQSCPEPLYFDSVEKVCKTKRNAVCGVRSSSEDNVLMIENENSLNSLIGGNNKREIYDNLDPSTCIGTCPEEDPEYAVLLPNDDCKKFCMCSNGIAWVLSCPEPLYFDSVEKVCKTKRNAVCGVRSSSEDNVLMIENENSLSSLTDENNERESYDNLDPSTCIGTCPEEDPEYAVLLPNDDCKKFCMCSNGIAWVLSCPEPLYFDSVEKVCKTKRKAVCGVREFNEDDVFTVNKK